MSEPVEWIWWGRDEKDVEHTSLGRWQAHPCQHRYKLAEVQPTEHDHPRTKSTSRRWRLGAKNDGLFIIDAEPHINTDGAGFDWPDGPDVVLNVVALTHDQAQAIVDAHNAAVEQGRKA